MRAALVVDDEEAVVLVQRARGDVHPAATLHGGSGRRLRWPIAREHDDGDGLQSLDVAVIELHRSRPRGLRDSAFRPRHHVATVRHERLDPRQLVFVVFEKLGHVAVV